MGYRSDIGLCLTKNAVEEFEKKLSQICTDEQMNDVQSLLYLRKTYRSDGSELWSWHNIKWYPDFSDIKFIECFMDYLDEDQYLFIRIGESDDDSEIKGCFHDNPFGMCLTRLIEFETCEATV